MLLTNVGTAHIENLASQDEIAREKGDLVAALTPDGVAVLNAEDPRVLAQRTRSRARVVTYGIGGDVRAENARARGDAGHAFTLVAPAGRVEIEIAGLARTTVLNALSAAAAAIEAGASLADVVEGLRRWRAPDGRMAPQRRVTTSSCSTTPQREPDGSRAAQPRGAEGAARAGRARRHMAGS